MKIIITVLLTFWLHAAHSQTIEKWEYCQISVPFGGFNSKNYAMYDFGDRVIKSSNHNDGLRDSTGQIEFKSPIHVLNYLGENGWECFSHSQENGLAQEKLDVFYFRRRKK